MTAAVVPHRHIEAQLLGLAAPAYVAHGQQQQLAGGKRAAPLLPEKRAMRPRRLGCARCICCSGPFAHEHSFDSSSEEFGEWWSGGIASPTLYFMLRRRQLTQHIRHYGPSPDVWRAPADAAAVGPSEMLLKRGARVLSLGVPATFTNVQQNDTTVQFLRTIQVPLELPFSPFESTAVPCPPVALRRTAPPAPTKQAAPAFRGRHWAPGTAHLSDVSARLAESPCSLQQRKYHHHQQQQQPASAQPSWRNMSQRHSGHFIAPAASSGLGGAGPARSTQQHLAAQQPLPGRVVARQLYYPAPTEPAQQLQQEAPLFTAALWLSGPTAQGAAVPCAGSSARQSSPCGVLSRASSGMSNLSPMATLPSFQSDASMATASGWGQLGGGVQGALRQDCGPMEAPAIQELVALELAPGAGSMAAPASDVVGCTGGADAAWGRMLRSLAGRISKLSPS